MFYFIFPGELDRTFLYLWPEHIPSDFWVPSPRRIRTRQVFFFKQVYILELFFLRKYLQKSAVQFFLSIFFSVGEVEKNPEYKELRKHLGIMHYILRTNPDLKISKKLLVIYLRVKDLL